MGTTEEIQIARDSYDSLTPEAKAIFDSALAEDPDLLEFHKTYVDPSFKAPSKPARAYSTYAVAAADPMTILSAQLAALSLPSAVVYSLKAMGAGMIAAIADGPLPLGDILLAAATVNAAIVIAANWNSISSKWTQIVAAFKKAFADSANNVISAFNSIKRDINAEVSTNPCVTVSGTTITVNGTKYRCTTNASSVATSMKSSKHTYYPAVLSGGKVLVAPVNIPRNIALAIMKFNSSSMGVFALTSTYARGLCSGLGGAIGPENHGSTEGYWYHYHGANYRHAHCWYFI